MRRFFVLIEKTINKKLSGSFLSEIKLNGDLKYHCISTGYEKLNKSLTLQGWPKGCATEVLLNQTGVGELQLFFPILANLSKKTGFSLLINPPFMPYVYEWQQHKIHLNKLVILRETNIKKAIWAAHQALISNSCASLFVWLPENKSYRHEVQKLSIGARSGQAIVVIFRHVNSQKFSSFAKLRMTIELNRKGKSVLNIFKQPGGWSEKKVELDLIKSRYFWTPLGVEDWPFPSANNIEFLKSNLQTSISFATKKHKPMNVKAHSNWHLH